MNRRPTVARRALVRGINFLNPQSSPDRCDSYNRQTP